MADVVCVMGVVAVIAAVGKSEALVLGRRRAAVEGALHCAEMHQGRPTVAAIGAIRSRTPTGAVS